MGMGAPRRAAVGIVLLAGLSTRTAYADAGTPLLWATFFHLLVGNAILGIIEGAILARFFGARRKRAIGLMVAANYLSAWSGLLVLLQIGSQLPPTVLNIGMLYASMLVALPLITLALEYPFVVMALECRPPRLWPSLKANLLLQGVTYLLLLPFLLLELWALSGFLALDKHASPSFTDNSNAVVYFVSKDGNSVFCVRLGDGKAEKAADTGDKTDLLVSRKNTASGQWDLRRKTETTGDLAAEVPVLANFASYAAESGNASSGVAVRGAWTQDLRAQDDRDWSMRAGAAPWASFYAHNGRTGERLVLHLDFPWFLGSFSHVTALPHEEVLFQWGTNICLLDLRERKLGLIALGHSPVVGLDAPPALEHTSTAP